MPLRAPFSVVAAPASVPQNTPLCTTMRHAEICSLAVSWRREAEAVNDASNLCDELDDMTTTRPEDGQRVSTENIVLSSADVDLLDHTPSAPSRT